MISRRNIRVKVMQTLYTASTLDIENKPVEATKILQKNLDQSRSLLVYLIYFLTEVIRYAEKDAYQKASKHLPTAEDLSTNTKIAGNELLWKILEDPLLKDQFSKDKPELSVNKELIRKIFFQLKESDEYKNYIVSTTREKKEENKIIEFVLNDLMLASEIFVSDIEEHFTNWDDDGEMVIQLLVGYLQKPASINFNEIMSKDKAAFANILLETVLVKNDMLQQLIKPKLKNWDPERIAQLDMIMMKMGVAEFLFFETIPPKVTINEYIDLAKDYSTPQSGQFVNGILDNIHKELVTQGGMQKIEYKKS